MEIVVVVKAQSARRDQETPISKRRRPGSYEWGHVCAEHGLPVGGDTEGFAQAILFRGAGLSDVWPRFLATAVIAALFLGLAVMRFRRVADITPRLIAAFAPWEAALPRRCFWVSIRVQSLRAIDAC
jgi:hypothetical protein